MKKNYKWKRAVASALLCSMAVTAMPAGSFQPNATFVVKAEALNVYDDEFNIKDGVLVAYRGDDTEVKVPEGVTVLDDFCFAIGDAAVTKVELPDTVKKIGHGAFYNCESLESVTMTGSVEEIEGSAFWGCTNLKDCELQTGLKAIGTYAFAETALEDVTIPGTVQTVMDSTFYDCVQLKNLVIEEGVTSIEEDAFYESSLESISLPKSLQEIGSDAFYKCENLTKASIKGGSVGKYAFRGCKKLKNLELAEGVTNIGNFAFSGCEVLKEVTIPGTVESVGMYAFEECKALETLVLQDGVQKIEDGAFEQLTNLKSVTFPEGLKKLGYGAFYGDTAIESVELKSAEIMDSSVFSECSGIKEVTLRANVKQVGRSCFSGADIEKLTIEAGVEQIGDSAFDESENLKTVELPSSIAVIGSFAFGGCKNLETVTLPSTIKFMSSSAFMGTKWYNRLTRGTETVIKNQDGTEDYEYEYDTTGKYIVVGNVLLDLAEDFNLEKDTLDQLPEEVNVIADLQAYRKEEVVVPDGIISIGDDAFSLKAQKITIPDSVAYLGEELCFGNDNLQEIRLPQYIETLPAGAFYGCENIKEIKIPKTVKILEDRVFQNCKSLTSIELPEGLTTIGYGTFKGCTGISTYTIPKSVTFMDYEVFDEDADITIKGYKGSVAESYAKEYGYTFVSIGELDPDVEETFAPDPTLEPKPTAPVVTDETEAPVQETKEPEETEVPDEETEEPEETEVPDEETEEPEETKTPDEETDAPEKTKAPEKTEVPAKETEKPENTKAPESQDSIEKKGYVITLDENGGSLESHYVTVINGETYGSLPAPSKAGHQFLGWYTERENGTKIENSTTVNLSSDQTLYAHWAAEECELTFNSNGGPSASVEKRSVKYGQVYGKLPVLTDTRKTFLGWYTEREGGNLITDDMIVDMTGQVTLYAHWSENYQPVTEDSLTYSFGNSSSDFGYASNYRIPLSVYQYMYGNSQYARTLYDNMPAWGGSCYGIATTSILFNTTTDNIELKDFSSSASKVANLKITDVNNNNRLSLKRFIESLHVSQFDASVTSKISENMNKATQLYQAADAVQQKKGDPIVVCLYGPEGGHAVVGYKAEKEETANENGYYDGKVYIYDPNYPQNDTRAVDVQLDSAGNVIYWHYKINDMFDWSSDRQGCSISYLPYEVYYQMWEKTGQKTYDSMDMVTLNIKNAIIYNGQGQQVATIEDGTLVSNVSDISQIVDAQVTEESSSDSAVKLFIPAGKYTFENKDSEELSMCIMGTDANAQVDTQSKKVSVNLDEITSDNQVQIALDQGAKYTVKLQSSSTNDKKEVVVSGTGTGNEEISISQKQGDVQLKNCDNATVQVNGESVNCHQITATAGEGGNISREGTVGTLSGEETVYSFTPDYGYMVKDVVVDGVSQGNISSYIFNDVKEDHTISVSF